jgi:hypothetical protein
VPIKRDSSLEPGVGGGQSPRHRAVREGLSQEASLQLNLKGQGHLHKLRVGWKETAGTGKDLSRGSEKGEIPCVQEVISEPGGGRERDREKLLGWFW